MATLQPVASASAHTLTHESCHHTIFRPFPTPQTWRQWMYLCGIQGFFAGLIDGGANFGIAYAMYHGQKDVRMWVMAKNTVAGDLGVTPIIQTAVSMLITSTLVHTDLHNKAIPPMPFVYPHVVHLPDPRILINKVLRTKMATDSTYSDGEVWDEKALRYEPLRRGSLKYYFYMLVRFLFEGTEKNMLAARVGVKNWFGRLLWTFAQGAGLGIVFGFPLWCLAIVILGPIYGTGNMGNKWAPQVIKCVYAAILGWITNPVIAILALGSQSEHHLLVVPADPEAGVVTTEVENNTMQEVEELDATVDGTPPFVPPYRANTTGHFVFPGQKTSLEEPGTPGSLLLTPSRAADVRPPSGRARSGSVSVSKPPLTANASAIAQLTPGEAPSRPRGLTVSSYISTTSGSSFAYALGGTGGRAQRRPRANTALSARTLPDFARAGAVTPGSTGHPSPSPNRTSLHGTSPSVRPRQISAMSTRDGISSGAGDVPRLDIPKTLESGEQQDVFGRGGAVPQLILQRPSMEAPRESAEVRRESELPHVAESRE